MSNKKKIPCRVCGKLFTPCSYCETHSDVFRWRNFACSIECAKKYINKAIAYRESSKHLKEQTIDVPKKVNEVPHAPKRKTKKVTVDVVENN